MKKKIEIGGHKFTIRTWNYGQKQNALRKATKWVKKRPQDEAITPEVDPWTLNDYMLVSCIVEWDLLASDGKNKLAISVDNLHGIEPPELVEHLLGEIQEINGVSEIERKK